jgi:threonylcarbamoyladenosine tRNA methylthiotransferase MtaB
MHLYLACVCWTDWDRVKKTFHIVNFGCRATQSDGAAIEQAFLKNQLGKTDQWQNSDVVVINTCTVTHSADTEARHMIRRIHRTNPSARIVVTGCYAQRAADEISQMDGVTCVVGNSHKDQLVPLVLRHHLDTTPAGDLFAGNAPSGSVTRGAEFELSTEALRHPGAAVYCSSIFEAKELRSISSPSGAGRTRPLLKVQDGCSYRCSYCVIPYVRGDSRSLPADEVIRQVELLLDQGFKEIVLTGIHLGAYGRDLSTRENLAGLVGKILQQDRLERLRLSSVEPLELTDEVIELVAQSQRMARHFHIPLQSGSDRILRLMRRPYLANYYAGLVEKVRRLVPDAGIGADVMVGFPTETEADHEKTKELLVALSITYLHVFPYSERPGTASAGLRPLVPSLVVQQRGLELRQLGAKKNLQFRRSFLSKNLSVITLETDGQQSGVEAVSSNYLRVEIPMQGIAPNQVLQVQVTEITDNGLEGRVIQERAR